MFRNGNGFLSLLSYDVMAQVESFLIPEDKANLTRAFKRKKTIYDSLYWKNKFARHFPHLFKKLDNHADTTIDWLAEFRNAYKKEYDYDSDQLPRNKRILFSIVKEGAIAQLKELYLKGKFVIANIDYKDINGWSLIWWAKANKNQEMLDFFYAVKVEQLQKSNDSKYYRVLLKSAIMFHQKIGIIKKLISKIRDINKFYDSEGYNSLHLAAMQGQADIVQLLIEAGANVNLCTNLNASFNEQYHYPDDGISALIFAIVNGHKDVVDLLLKYKADITIVIPFHPLNFRKRRNITPGDTPLIAAIRTGNLDIIQAILKNATHLQATNTNQTLAMKLAIELGLADVVECLITFGAKVNWPDSNGCTLLFYAAENCQKSIVEILLKHKAEIDRELVNVDRYHVERGILKRDNAIVAALRVNRPDIALMILNKADKSQANSYMLRKAFMVAVKKGYVEIVTKLLKIGVDINTHSADGATALFLAIKYNHKAAVDVLLDNGANPCRALTTERHYQEFDCVPGDGPLMLAVKLNRVDMIGPLYRKMSQLTNTYDTCLAAFKFAVETGKSDIVKTFITCGFNPQAFIAQEKEILNVPELKLNSDFYTAVQLHHFDIAEGMLEKILEGSADYQIAPQDLEAALREAARCGRLELVELLIPLCANFNLNSQNSVGATALLYAVENNHKSIVELLLKHGAKINMGLNQNQGYHAQFNVFAGDNPLIAAAVNDRFDIVALLIKKITGKTKDKHDVISKEHLEEILRWAARKGQANIVRKLLQHGVNVNAKSPSGATALLLAVEHGHENVVDVLLEHNAATNLAVSKNHDYHEQFNVVPGDSPLHVAAKHNRDSIIIKLLNQKNNSNSIGTMNSKKQTATEVTNRNSSCQAKLQLFTLWNKLEKQEKTSDQRKTIRFFGQTWFVKASSKEIKEATHALKQVVFDGESKTVLDNHRVALRSPELKSIYQNLGI